MSSSQQAREGALTDYASSTPTKQEWWERPGWEREQQAIEAQRRVPDETSDNGVSVASVQGRHGAMGIWMKSLGGLGLMVGGVCAGYVAYQMGYDWRATSTIAALVGVATGAAGVMVPLLFRALGWAILAAFAGGVGAAALFVLTRVAPAFVDRIIEVIRDLIG